MKNLFLILAALMLWVSCNTTQKVATASNPGAKVGPTEPPLEERMLDTLVVTPEDNGTDYSLTDTTREEEEIETPTRYNPSHTRTHDLLHTKLELRFDWKKEQVIGKATLKLKPYFYPSNSVTLDAKGFEFKRVTFDGKTEPLKYEYDSSQLVINLGRTFAKGEEYTLYLEYTATPNATGGSDAITSNQGLFFIDPLDEDPEKPSQIWSQGETEWNSRWFPTIDKPNERCTEEMYLTVEDKYVTLSNGVLTSSKKNADGTRTDYWKMDQPHAPYLFMIAVGEFAVVKDKWRDIPLEYYVEPAYRDDAKAIFAHTPEMLEFFSTKLGIKYPWKKFSQIIVRDYVSGAMENTTAVVFGEFIQKHKRELIDNANDGIVAHEMFHHWFGDYVTTESWANLTMNEGFANYSEYLWSEYKYGKDLADYELFNTTYGYIQSAQGGVHPLIHFGYEDNEQMFDATSYNKGGAILHMLRKYVGEDAFWTALNLYLTENAYQSVEAHNLRLTFEKVTGEDLNWFWNQWYYSSGHPVLDLTYDYDEATKTASVLVIQKQDDKDIPKVFQLPVTVDIYTADGKVRHEKIRVTERLQTFTFENVTQRPKLINFDADKALVSESQDNKTEEELAFQFANAPTFTDRYEAMEKLAAGDTPQKKEVMNAALKDKLWFIRGLALSQVYENADEATKVTMRQMAASDPHSQIRASAIELLTGIEDPSVIAIAKKALESDSAYNVIGASLQALVKLDSVEALKYGQKLEKETDGSIVSALAALYANSKEAKYLAFFEKNFSKVGGYDAINFIESYQRLAATLAPEVTLAAMQKLQQIGTDQKQSQYHRFGAIRSLNDMRNDYNQRAKATSDATLKAQLADYVAKITKMMDTIKAAEPDEQLKAYYEQLVLIE